MILEPSLELTPRQKAFVKEYLKDLNGAQAAIRSGYSPKTARHQAQRLLTKAHVARAVQDGMTRRAKKVDLTAENILESIMDIRQMAVDQNKLPDALKANELLGKHLKLFTDRLEHTGNVTLQIINEFAD
jgi:phage terminase small subunit